VGKINSILTGHSIYLREYHTFGRRAEIVDNVIDHALISKVHAFIEWDGKSWNISDVSTNGVLINNIIIPKNKKQKLSLNDTICFCNQSDLTFKITDTSAPIDLLINTESNKASALKQHHILPCETNPEYGIYFCSDREAWFSENLVENSSIENDNESQALDVIEQGPFRHNDQIEISNTKYRFFLINPPQETELLNNTSPTINDIRFRYDLSIDEESTYLTLTLNNKKINLGERTHHYLIVYLLRERLRQSKKVSPANKPFLGWVDVALMTRDLGLDELHINTLIFRARKQFSEALVGIEGTGRLLERRRGMVRINTDNFSIYKGNTQIL